MSKPFKVTFHVRESGEEVTVASEFEDSEWELLIRFTEYAEQLAALNIDLSVNYTIRWDKDQGLSYQCKLPPESAIAAFLHRMRPFVLQNEDTSFYRICNILKRRMPHDNLRAVIERQHAEFSGRHFQTMITIDSNGVVLNADDTVTKWLNAFEYHRDADKRAELEALHKLLPLESSRALFLSMILDKAGAVCQIARIIHAIKKGEGTSLTVIAYSRNVEGGAR